MVNDNYLVLFSFLCCPLDAGFRLWENAGGELELLSVQKFPDRKWRKPCISTFKRTQQKISQRWSQVRLYGPLHEYLLPGDSSWKFHQLAAGQLLSGQPRHGTGKASSTALPSRTKSHLPGHFPPASQAGRRVGPALLLSASLVYTQLTSYSLQWDT